MRYFVDVEFNGFGGPLISLTLAPEDPSAAAFYEAVHCEEPEPWVAEHVMPVLRIQPISRSELRPKNAFIERGVVRGQELCAFKQRRQLRPQRAEIVGLSNVAPGQSVNV
jgi:hypothetical protein